MERRGLELPDGISLIIALVALGISSLAVWISIVDRQQDRKEQATRLRGEIKSNMASLEQEVAIASWELNMLDSEWNFDDKFEYIDSNRQQLQRLKESTAALQGQVNKISVPVENLNLLISAQASIEALRRTTTGTTTRFQAARDELSNRKDSMES